MAIVRIRYQTLSIIDFLEPAYLRLEVVLPEVRVCPAHADAAFREPRWVYVEVAEQIGDW